MLFGTSNEGNQSAYQEQINNINKLFGWYFIMKGLANNDITKIKYITEMPLEDIVNYMVISQQESQVEKYKENKNAIAL